MINKKAQVSLFIIIGLLIVAVIAIFLLTSNAGNPIINIGEEFSPESFIDKCLRESLRNTVSTMLPQGGFVDPTDYKIYNNIRVTYLCKNINFYEPCITQYPLFITRLEEEIEYNTQENIEQCFISLEQELEDRGYEFSGGKAEVESKVKPGLIELSAFRDFSFSKGGVAQDFDGFKVGINSPLYDLGSTANEIVSQESEFCYFEYVGFDLLYNDFDVKKYTMSDSTKIYSIKDKSSGEEMNIAVRGCVIPAGF
jgi:hypothetical protein